jgi:hypothetical protein
MQFAEQTTRLPILKWRRRSFPFPIGPHLRIAQVTSQSLFEDAGCFAFGRWHELAVYQPQVLIGPAVELRMLATRVQEGRLDLTSVDHAVLVTTEVGAPLLSDVTRVVLWQVFGVPVYELLMSPDGKLLALECQAYEGWHVESQVKVMERNGEIFFAGKAWQVSMKGHLTKRVCACGQTGIRILRRESGGMPQQVAALAATA